MLHDHLSGCRKQKHLYDRARLMSTKHFHKLHADCKRHDIFHVILQFNFIMPYIEKALPYKLYNKHHYHKHQYCRQKKFHVGCYIFHCFSQELLHYHLFLSFLVTGNNLFYCSNLLFYYTGHTIYTATTLLNYLINFIYIKLPHNGQIMWEPLREKLYFFMFSPAFCGYILCHNTFMAIGF